MSVSEKLHWQPKWTVRKFHDGDYEAGKEPYETVEFDGNLLLNEGITEMLNLVGGIAATAWSNANAYLGVGNSSTAASATDTDLIGASKLYKAMEATYPQVSGQTITWRAAFGAAEANFAWEEFTVSNTSSGTGDNLNRKVQSLGTKASGTWTLDLDITIS